MNYKSFTQIVILGSSNFVPFMQLTQAHRREVIEDLLDIRIFSAMNNFLKEDIRQSKEMIKSLTLKKSNIKDKIEMQSCFIGDLEDRHKNRIDEDILKIEKLSFDSGILNLRNEDISKNIELLNESLKDVANSTQQLRKLGSLKGKISQKVSAITKEHKFFTENTVCPTCTQPIQEDLRLNKISDAQYKAKELQEGFLKLEESIQLEEDKERYFKKLSTEITELTHDISQNNVRIAGYQRQVGDLQSEIQTLTSQLQNRNSEHEKLDGFKDSLQVVFNKLARKK